MTSDYNVSSVKDGKSVVRVNRSGNESVAYIPVLPCSADAGITFTVYYEGGKSYSKTSAKPIDFERNRLLLLGVFPLPE